jgi:DnaJ-class molecular chaperone
MPSTGFERCQHCDGLGFVRKGTVPDDHFDKCPYCKGLGQKYLEPAKAEANA